MAGKKKVVPAQPVNLIETTEAALQRTAQQNIQLEKDARNLAAEVDELGSFLEREYRYHSLRSDEIQAELYRRGIEV